MQPNLPGSKISRMYTCKSSEKSNHPYESFRDWANSGIALNAITPEIHHNSHIIVISKIIQIELQSALQLFLIFTDLP